MRSILAALSLLVLSAPALAAEGTVPEPGALALIGLAAAAGLAVALRKRK